jgi:hypothetical protein
MKQDFFHNRRHASHVLRTGGQTVSQFGTLPAEMLQSKIPIIGETKIAEIKISVNLETGEATCKSEVPMPALAAADIMLSLALNMIRYETEIQKKAIEEYERRGESDGSKES